MKRIISIWMTAARTLLWKLLLIAVLMTGIETALFWRTLNSELPVQSIFSPYREGFSSLVEGSHLLWIFGLALVAACAALCFQGSQLSGGQMRYTLQRLPLREETVTLLWAVFHAGYLVILWACQLAVVFGLWMLYLHHSQPAGGELELFISFYYSGVLHGLLPLADLSRHISNLFWVVSLAFHTAAFGYFQRRGRFRVEILILLAVGLAFFDSDINIREPWINLGLSLLWLALIGFTIYRMKEARNETD